MATRIKIDLERTLGNLDRNIFGGFAEHLGRCIYGGIYEPGSPHADAEGIRTDVLEALKRLDMPNMRYPGGNFVSGYRWRDGVGPKEARPARMELAWHDVEPNTFGTNEFVDFCRKLGTEPYMAVNCGDGDMRDARDWLEYCNGTKDTALVKLRKEHGYDAPHNIKYWGIGNEVDGPWQIGFKSPEEYARAYTEYAKVMKWTDPSIQLFASAVSVWQRDLVERAQLLFEEVASAARGSGANVGNLIDYMALHWYVGNDELRGYRDDDFASYMAVSELLEDRLSGYEGLVRGLMLDNRLTKPIYLAVDEWNVWYRTGNVEKLEEVYNLEDALMTGIQLNAFIRHAKSVKFANIAQIVNVIAPIMTHPDGMFLQTIFYPFEVYSQTAGDTALDVHWTGDTFSTPEHEAVRFLDVTATLDTQGKKLAVYVVNRSPDAEIETQIDVLEGQFSGQGKAFVINGADIKTTNSFDATDGVTTREDALSASGTSTTYSFEPHSVTALVFELG